MSLASDGAVCEGRREVLRLLGITLAILNV